MLIPVINAVNYAAAKNAIEQNLAKANGFELRLDYWQHLNFDEVAKLRESFSIPLIFTLRKQSQGGLYSGPEEQRLKDIAKLCELQPDYLDVEYDIDSHFLQNIKTRFPRIKFICSYHDYKATPNDLTVILQQMQKTNCHYYKIATQANCAMDTVRMLQLIQNNAGKIPFIGISMGEFGIPTRIIGKILGNQFTFAALNVDQAVAPGQLTVHELTDIYHYQQMNSSTKIYALLGDPVAKSVGHLWHNKAFALLKEDAVYLKMRVTEQEAAEVLQELKQLPFSGFSVTMPLKQIAYEAMDELNDVAKKIHAVNTVIVNNAHYSGFNTDGLGAMQALENHIKSLANKIIVIIGAGGAARAIIYSARQLGAEVHLFNRSIEKAKELAAEFKCKAYALNQLDQIKQIPYAVIINTLPVAVQQEHLKLLQSDIFKSGAIAMDIVYNPVDTPFLQLAAAASCICVPGYEMYVEQALLQLKHWFNSQPDELAKLKLAISSQIN